MKRPAFQFYPADWRKDVDLQSCSMLARGLWHELLCVMHECKPYGHLILQSGQPTDSQTARLVGMDLKTYKAALAELEAGNVFSRLENGTIYSRRMVKDERLRTMRAAAGSKGGNPVLLIHKDNHLLNQMDNTDVKQTPTPSSSASTASSSSKTLPTLPSVDNSSSGASATEGSNGSRVFEREDQKAADPWPRRIPDVTDEKTLEKCARAYGIDVKSRRFETYSELRSACFEVRNTLREQHEGEHAIGAKQHNADH